MATKQQQEVLRLSVGIELSLELMRLRKDEQLGFDFEIGELF